MASYRDIATRATEALPAPLRTQLGKRILLALVIVLLSAFPLVETALPGTWTEVWQGESPLTIVALVLLMGFMVTSAGAYLRIYDRPVYERFRDLELLGALFVGMVWITRIVLWIQPDISPYVLPVPLAAMLATLLLSAREGLLISMMTTVAGVLLGFTAGSTIVATLVWSIAAVAAMAFMTERRRLFLVGGTIVAAGAASALLATLASGMPLSQALEAAGWGVVGGTISSVAAYGLLPFFEVAFGVTTDLRLLELGSPAHPLLRELMVTAPGTYSHSVAAANLAEAAAEEIGANPLLARVGAYYHDVGKIKRPGFFFENLTGGSNPHDTQQPTLSARIITSHVRDGMDLAEQYHLPEEVLAIIRQHHGTSLVRYFYNKAAEQDAGVFEADFRYQGQRPQSREAALVMLADASEAAVRALKRPTQIRVDSTVRKVVDEKLSDSQLDDADMTLADIERVVKVYARLLTSMYHARCEYPEGTKKRSADARQRHQPSRA